MSDPDLHRRGEDVPASSPPRCAVHRAGLRPHHDARHRPGGRHHQPGALPPLREHDDLGLDLYRRCYRATVDAVRRAALAADGPLARLAAYATALAALYEREPLTVLFVDEHQLRFWPELRTEFEPDTLSGMVARWVEAGRRDGTLGADVDATAQVALVMGVTSQWFAMRRAGLASAASAASLPVLLRRALTHSLRAEDST
jgi:hypothetical protein